MSHEATPLQELLLADHRHFSDSLWLNEQAGEKRLSFLISLITAAVAGLVALNTSDGNIGGIDRSQVTNVVLVALAVLGVFTFFRMVQRNRVTDDYKQTLRYIRDTYNNRLVSEEIDYVVPQLLDRRRWISSFLGGLAETSGAITSILIATVIYRWCESFLIGGAIFLALTALFCLVARAGRRSWLDIREAGRKP